METKDFTKILLIFEEPDNSPITDLIKEIADEYVGEKFQKEVEDLEGKITGHIDLGAIFTEYSVANGMAGFALGVAFRDMFEVFDEDVRAEIEEMKDLIKAKKLLPYLPNNPTNK